MLTRRYDKAESLDGVIDLERLRSGAADSLERNAQKFFELTYLSEDLHMVLRGLSRRFKEGGPGTVLAQAVKGLGKSHTLLLGYHLFASPDEAKAWTAKAGCEWAPPVNTEIPPSLIEEHIRKDMQSLFGQRVDQVDRTYRNTLGFPVPFTISVVTDALQRTGPCLETHGTGALP